MKRVTSLFKKLGWVEARKTIEILGAMLGLVLLCLPSFAQQNLGRLYGGITDKSGGAVAGATVTVIDEARGVSRPLVSDGAGEYAAPNLTPGTYTVRAEASGFEVAQHTGVEVGVGQDIRVDLTLQPGAQTQTVTVTGEIPMVNTANAQLEGTLEAAVLDELPVNGRNYEYLEQTHPGVIMKPVGGQNVFNLNGTSVDDVGFYLDGIIDYNLFGGGGSIVGSAQLAADEATILPLDSIEAVDIIMTPKAEYGDRLAGQFNIGLKSGTNTLHGSAYAFGRSSVLDSRNPFLSPALQKAPLALTQYGASLGGAIKKNKLFYFMNYEGMRFSVGTPSVSQIPTTADIGASGTGTSIPDAVYDILHNSANTAGVIPSALSLNLMGCQALVPSGSVTAGGALSATQVAVLKAETMPQLASGCNPVNGILGTSGNTSSTAAKVLDLVGTGGSDNSIIKFDYHPNDHHAINGEWFTGGGTQFADGTGLTTYWGAVNYTWVDMARAVWIWTPNSSWTNEVRVGYEYLDAPVYTPECDPGYSHPNYAALGFISGAQLCNPSNPVLPLFPDVTVSGFSAMGFIGFGLTTDRFNNYGAVLDNVSYTRGRHLFKFGFEFRPNYFKGNIYSSGGATMTFGSVAAFPGASALEDFMAGVPAGATVQVGDPTRSASNQYYGGYVQDDWRVLTRLTLNLGLRYEYQSPARALGNGFANFQPQESGSPSGLIQQTNSTSVYKAYPYMFEPRFGFAWDIFGSGRTVLRGGFGVTWDSTTEYNKIMGLSADLNVIPTGFTFYNPNGSSFAGPGNIAVSKITPTTAQLPWLINTPVFNTSVGATNCGDGIAPVNPVAGAPAVNPPPCQLYALAPESQLYGSEAETWTFGIQHAFTNNLSLDVEYVGMFEPRIGDEGDLNAAAPGIKNTATNGYIQQARRADYATYPFYSDIFYTMTTGYQHYNALEAGLTQRVSHGLNFSAGFTWEHALSAGGLPMEVGNPALTWNQKLGIDYGTSPNNIAVTVPLTVTYVIPGRKSPGQMLEGWQVNSSVILQAGPPINAVDSADNISGTGTNADRWTLAGTPSDFKLGGPGPTPCWGVTGSSFAKATNCSTVAAVTNMPALCQSAAAAEPVNSSLPAGTAAATGLTALSTYGCYMMGASAIVPPAQGTFGTMGYDALRGKGFHNWDFSVSKNWKFRERYGMQFRAEFFNVLNRALYNPPGATLSSPTSFGESTSTPGESANPVLGPGERKIQFGLKFTF